MENIIFNDYASWLLESDDILNKIKEEASFIYERYEHIFNVVTHIYNMKIDKKELNEDEFDIFKAGFTFLYDRIKNIVFINKTLFNDNIKELNKHQKAFSLLLDIQEFNADLESILDDNDKLKPLKDLEDEVYELIKNKKELKEEVYERFNVISMDVYRENEINFYPLKEIFYDIAEIFDLL